MYLWLNKVVYPEFKILINPGWALEVDSQLNGSMLW